MCNLDINLFTRISAYKSSSAIFQNIHVQRDLFFFFQVILLNYLSNKKVVIILISLS